MRKGNAMTDKEAYWSRFADDFENQSNYVVGQADVDIILNRLAGQADLKKTLELGCGHGTYSKVLAPAASALYATDFSDEMVAASKRRLAAFAHVTVEKQNCFNLSYADHSFDTVLMANLLHIVPEPDQAIGEANRVLKTGGVLIVISYTIHGMKLLHKLAMIYRYLKTWGRPSPHARTLNPALAGEMISARGFEITHAELLGVKSKAVFIRAVKADHFNG
jgi:ubiquinone/menaquinone biosynthesis C-methylase UbiE